MLFPTRMGMRVETLVRNKGCDYYISDIGYDLISTIQATSFQIFDFTVSLPELPNHLADYFDLAHVF